MALPLQPLCLRQLEERVVFEDAERMIALQLAGLEAAESDDVPEGSGDVAAHLVAAVRGEGGPAFAGVEEDSEEPGSAGRSSWLDNAS